MHLGEWRHDVASKRLHDAGKGRDGSGDIGLRHEAHNANHRKASVVDLLEEARGLLLRRILGGDAKRIVERELVQVRLVEGNVLERRVLARLAAAHVVLAAELTPPLEEADE